jgi:catechol 2,3-dioxygenase-like lactoylglutathione lyase family enzyme
MRRRLPASTIIAGMWLAGSPIAPGVSIAAVGRLADAAVRGLDHIPIAVHDLEAAAARYRELGFTLKPGTPHDNGIRNQHVKFADGTELELITAPRAVDPLTSTYRQHLSAGDGPAFVAFYAPSMVRVAEQLDVVRQAYRKDHVFIDIPNDDPIGYVFFGPRNRSPTDRPEHFAHANSADSLVAVWIAADDLSRERRLLQALGATFARKAVRVPDPLTADVARLPEGDVLLLPGARQLVPGRRIVGATLRVRSLENAKAVLSAIVPALDLRVGGDATSIILPPSVTHGLWLELRERP